VEEEEEPGDLDELAQVIAQLVLMRQAELARPAGTVT
jgi:hypothetical protein